MSSKLYRRLSIRLPVFALIASFILLAPSIWFKLFPSGDNPFLDYEIVAQEGTTTDAMVRTVQGVDTIVAAIPELKSYEITINKNIATIGINLVKKAERKRDSFAVEEELTNHLSYLVTQWYKVTGKVQAGGPPAGKAVGIQLVTDDKNKLPQLKAVSKEFEAYVKTLTGTINVSNSSSSNPGQFSVRFDDQKLAQQWISPQDIKGELYAMLQWARAGTMTLESIDRDIVVRIQWLSEGFSPDQLQSLILQTRAGPLALNSVASVQVGQSLTSIVRKDGNISIQVEADLDAWLTPTAFQPKLVAYADAYDFPDGISYKQAGENEANKELIQATGIAFVIALVLSFAILVYQFNSFSKPAMVLYSIITALLGVNVWLRVTGSPYSMAFGIGFISLIGVVINTAIFLVDRINYNLEHGADIDRAIQEAGYVRFKPILISTITTTLGLGSVITQDEFYATLWYTVIFGLIFSSVITLIAVPNLYYALFKRKEKKLADKAALLAE